MQPTDRSEFEEILGRLCASYEVPATKHRRDAHWADLRKMTLAQYRRCVDFACSDDGPEALPGTKGIWRIHRQLTNPGGAKAMHTERQSEPDHLEYFANRLLFRHIAARSGLGSTSRFKPGYGLVDCKASDELKDALAAKLKLVEEFVGYVREADELATPAEFIRAFLSIMRRVSPLAPEYAKRLREAMDAPGANQPFEPHMARELTPRQAELV